MCSKLTVIYNLLVFALACQNIPLFLTSHDVNTENTHVKIKLSKTAVTLIDSHLLKSFTRNINISYIYTF